MCKQKRSMSDHRMEHCETILLRRWDFEQNDALMPERIFCGSGRKVLRQCSADRVRETDIHAWTGPQKSGCPECAGTRLYRGRGMLTTAITVLNIDEY